MSHIWYWINFLANCISIDPTETGLNGRHDLICNSENHESRWVINFKSKATVKVWLQIKITNKILWTLCEIAISSFQILLFEICRSALSDKRLDVRTCVQTVDDIRATCVQCPLLSIRWLRSVRYRRPSSMNQTSLCVIHSCHKINVYKLFLFFYGPKTRF